MARRKATIHPLPDWFDLKAYDALLELTNDELMLEHSIRHAINISPNVDDIAKTSIELFSRGNVLLVGSLVITDPDCLLTGGEKLQLVELEPGFVSTGIVTYIRSPEPSAIPEPDERTCLSEGYHIQPTSFLDLQSMLSFADGEKIFRPPTKESNGHPLIRTSFRRVSVSSLLANGKVEAEINIEGSTDAEIVADLTELLPLWREQLGIPEPAKRESGAIGPSVIKRLIQYQIIPMLDLMIWANLNGFEYSAEQLSRSLYPNEIVTAKHVSDTHQPFAMKFSDEHYTDMIMLWRRQTDRGTGKRNGERLVKDTIAGTG